MGTFQPQQLTPIQYRGGVTIVPISYLEYVLEALTYWQDIVTTDYPVFYPIGLVNGLLALPLNKNPYMLSGNCIVPIEDIYQFVNAFSVWETQSTIDPRYASAESLTRSCRDNFTAGFIGASLPIYWVRN